MKDNMKPCQHTLCDDVEYKEVVVIGNGPSGMVTSFMLAGNVPYLKPLPEDLAIDEMLRARLTNLPPGQSLYETDLLALAEGLEGRSQNPIPLLMDNLLRPCADLGVQADSLIDWQYEVEKKIDHIVLGRGPPGGAWHTFPPSVLTLSPGAWLSLPPHQTAGSGRLPARAVAKYCTRYVQACNLQRYFRSGVIVTSVQHSRRAPAPPCGRTCPLNTQFWVTGYDITTGRILRWWCRRVVACCGAGDRPNLLSPAVPALTALGPAMRALSLLRDSPSPDRPSVLVVGSGVSAADAVRLALRRGARVLHAHRTPAHALAALSPQHYPDYTQVYNMMCSGHSESSYYTSFPEHVIASVTPDTQQTEDDPDLQPKTVKLLNIRTNQTSEHIVSLIVVLIGSKPDLCFLQTNPQPNHCHKCSDNTKRKTQSYLKNWHYLKNWQYLKTLLSQSIQSCKSRLSPDTAEVCKLDLPIVKCPVKECQCDSSPYSSGIGFGVDPSQPVDARGNPLAVDVGSHEVVKAPGVHALGPLTADNFMRFIPGGALAIVAHLHKEGLTDC